MRSSPSCHTDLLHLVSGRTLLGTVRQRRDPALGAGETADAGRIGDGDAVAALPGTGSADAGVRSAVHSYSGEAAAGTWHGDTGAAVEVLPSTGSAGSGAGSGSGSGGAIWASGEDERLQERVASVLRHFGVLDARHAALHQPSDGAFGEHLQQRQQRVEPRPEAADALGAAAARSAWQARCAGGPEDGEQQHRGERASGSGGSNSDAAPSQTSPRWAARSPLHESSSGECSDQHVFAECQAVTRTPFATSSKGHERLGRTQRASPGGSETGDCGEPHDPGPALPQPASFWQWSEADAGPAGRRFSVLELRAAGGELQVGCTAAGYDRVRLKMALKI